MIGLNLTGAINSPEPYSRVANLIIENHGNKVEELLFSRPFDDQSAFAYFSTEVEKAMRKLVLCVVLIVFGIGASALVGEPLEPGGSKINWLTSMGGAIEQARAQDKPILMDFFNPN
jgi:hypothetical protein